MDFGRLPDPAALADIDFTLPPDPPQNAAVLPGTRAAAPAVYVGCPSWNHPEWIGTVYAAGRRTREFLPEYVRQFNSIEGNATAYRMPEAAKINLWRSTAPPDFKYCLKLPQSITHYGKLRDPQEVRTFADRIALLGPNAGPPLLQFADNFGPKRWPDLEAFLRSYPGTPPPALELRHRDWYTHTHWLELLRQLQYPVVVTDTAGRRDIVHMHLTAPTAFVRWTGNNLHPTDYARLDAWAERCADWIARGLPELYFFLHSRDKLYCPPLVDYFIQRLNERTGLRIRSWTPVGRQQTLL